jgi:hypothetical protein
VGAVNSPTPITSVQLATIPVNGVAIGDVLVLSNGANTLNLTTTSSAGQSATPVTITVSSVNANFTYTPGTATIHDNSWPTPQSWVFTPNVSQADVAKTFTFQHGDPATRADQFSFGIFTDLQFSMDRTKFEVTGTVLGQSLVDNITMTATPTFLPLNPIVPGTLSVFADTTAGGIGGTQLSRVLTMDWHLTNKYGPIWTLDATKPSFAGVVEMVPTMTATVMMEADAVGMAFLNNVRVGSTMFVRVKGTGPNVGSSIVPYSLTWDMPVKIINTQGFSDHNGVYAIQWEFACVFDSTFNAGAGGALLGTVVNGISAL